MGTHPIFESDFDCLTECSPGRAFDLSGQIRSNCRFRSMVCPDLTLRLPIPPRSRPENSLPSWPTLTTSPTLLAKTIGRRFFHEPICAQCRQALGIECGCRRNGNGNHNARTLWDDGGKWQDEHFERSRVRLFQNPQ